MLLLCIYQTKHCEHVLQLNIFFCLLMLLKYITETCGRVFIYMYLVVCGL